MRNRITLKSIKEYIGKIKGLRRNTFTVEDEDIKSIFSGIDTIRIGAMLRKAKDNNLININGKRKVGSKNMNVYELK